MPSANASAADLRPGRRESAEIGVAPVGEDEFGRLIRAVEPALTDAPPSLFLAGVSGGADSMALCLLLDRWCRANGHRFRALIVDHGLRAESAAEAARVSGWLQARGIASDILRWSAGKPVAGVQAAARAARFALMTGRARELGARGIFLAHHLEDQAETMVMRLGRDSGPDGLAGIRMRQMHAEFPVYRPLLGISPQRLRAHCVTEAQAWIEDPSNRNRKFERVRVRQEADGRRAAGLDAMVLHRVASVFSRLRDWSDGTLASFLREAGELDPRGFVRLDPITLKGLPAALRRKLLSGLLQSVGGGGHPPRGESLARLERWVSEGGFSRVTLAGCLVWRTEKDGIWIVRETPRGLRPRIVGAGAGLRWDGRFDVIWREDRPAWVHMLTRAGDRRLRRLRPPAGSALALPESVRCSLPAVTDLDGRLFAPHFPETWTDAAQSEDGRLQIEFRPAVPWVADAFRASRDDRAGAKV
ncbi:tRNA lysidine(34) synthetase TilS [Nisaea sediminum]|uniref:tRNA lysidine(34) synthetase TilS n=1 Tax=Nisaea sediminum TaxID=2775867 RepID=UPI001865E6FF|nr:tRNA lysidine(34) synthetase TilS [Nisaea sediminum]